MRTTALLPLAVLAAGVLPSAATAATPKPVPCAETATFEDPAGDQRLGFSSVFTPAPAEATQDIKALFFRGEKGKVTANVVLAEAPADAAAAPPGSLGLVYRLLYTTPDEVRRYFDVSFSTLFGTSYNYGHFETSGLVSDGTGTGKVFAGKDGVIQFTIPGLKPGQPLSAVSERASRDQGAVIANSDVVGPLDFDGTGCPVVPA